MNDLGPFQPASPAMIVGRAFDGGPAPLSLDEPFALRGGDRLTRDAIPFELMHEHQPDFLRWATSTCQGLVAAGRTWFRAAPALLTGPPGSGRTHAARWLATTAHVPHVILNLTDPLIASCLASSGKVGEAVWATPVTVAMAATKCANPVVTVVGIDRVGDDVAAGFLSMIDPVSCRSWAEDRLGVWMDFGEVSWTIQCDDLARVPLPVRELAAHITFLPFPPGIMTTAAVSILLEVIADLGLDRTDPALDWPLVTRQLGRQQWTAKWLYQAMTRAVSHAVSDGQPALAFD